VNVFITGASSGIGAALAREYAARGATLGLVARRQALLDELVQSLPGTHHTYAIDVTDKDALIAAARAFEQTTGGVDVVIANAGISVGVLTEHYEDLDAFKDVLNVNVLAMATTFHRTAARTRPRQAGWHCECGRHSRLAGVGSVLRIESGRHQLLRKLACRVAPLRHSSHHGIARLRAHAADGEESLPHAVLDGTRRLRARRG
jgi:hypothetical protein